MIKDLFTYFIGTYLVCVSPSDRTKAVAVMYEHGLYYSHSKLADNGTYSFVATSITFQNLQKLFKAHNIEYTHSSINGFPKAVNFIFKRPGIIVGFFIFLTFMIISSRTVWSIQISGNSTVPDGDILALLEELGCGYGDYIPGIDFDVLHARFIARSENISWIAVNMKGNHANVEVLETKNTDTNSKEKGAYANIIAKEDAQVVIIKTAAGVPAVSEGDTVKKGELLVSGIIGVREGKVRYEYAEAEVLAYVPRIIEIKIPLTSNEKSYTGNIFEEKTLKILKKSINLSAKGGIKYAVYDKIIDNRQIMLFGRFPLPIWLETTVYKEYTYTSKLSSQEDAISSAMAELRHELDTVLETSELITNSISTEISDDFFAIKYEMICLTNIAEVCEFSVHEFAYKQDTPD